MNELSCTIDLDSTLIRAEALFKRFQRLVDAVDKKGHFPAPPSRPRLTQGAGSGSSSSTSSSSQQRGAADNNGKAPAQSQQQQQQKKEPERVITPELRQLLSRQVEVLPRKEVAKKGDGLAGIRGR